MNTKLTILAVASAVSLSHQAWAQGAKPEGAKADIYGSLRPFSESGKRWGARAGAPRGGASRVPAAAYTGINDPARFRMTAGTSAIGFRGSWEFIEGMKVIWQVESAVPIDGNGP